MKHRWRILVYESLSLPEICVRTTTKFPRIYLNVQVRLRMDVLNLVVPDLSFSPSKMEGELPVDVRIMIGDKRNGIGYEQARLCHFHRMARARHTFLLGPVLQRLYGRQYTEKGIDLGASKGVVAILLSYMGREQAPQTPSTRYLPRVVTMVTSVAIVPKSESCSDSTCSALSASGGLSGRVLFDLHMGTNLHVCQG